MYDLQRRAPCVVALDGVFARAATNRGAAAKATCRVLMFFAGAFALARRSPAAVRRAARRQDRPRLADVVGDRPPQSLRRSEMHARRRAGAIWRPQFGASARQPVRIALPRSPAGSRSRGASAGARNGAFASTFFADLLELHAIRWSHAACSSMRFFCAMRRARLRHRRVVDRSLRPLRPHATAAHRPPVVVGRRHAPHRRSCAAATVPPRRPLVARRRLRRPPALGLRRPSRRRARKDRAALGASSSRLRRHAPPRAGAAGLEVVDRRWSSGRRCRSMRTQSSGGGVDQLSQHDYRRVQAAARGRRAASMPSLAHLGGATRAAANSASSSRAAERAHRHRASCPARWRTRLLSAALTSPRRVAAAASAALREAATGSTRRGGLRRPPRRLEADAAAGRRPRGAEAAYSPAAATLEHRLATRAPEGRERMRPRLDLARHGPAWSGGEVVATPPPPSVVVAHGSPRGAWRSARYRVRRARLRATRSQRLRRRGARTSASAGASSRTNCAPA